MITTIEKFHRHRIQSSFFQTIVVLAAIISTGTFMSIPVFGFGIIGSKWPPGPVLGTQGAVSFSVMPPGINMAGDIGGHGHSADLGLSTNFNALMTQGANQNELSHVLTAFDTWANAPTDLLNLGVVADNGALFNAAPADPRFVGGPFGDIRLAATQVSVAGELAHAHFPPPTFGVSAPGDIHFNNQFTWSDDPTDSLADNDFDFQTVALHELGHSLGLLHTNVPGAVMNPFYAGARRSLSQDDIDGIQTIYGPRALLPCVPPPSQYAASQHSYPGFNINNPSHSGFPNCDPLPPPRPGGQSSHEFGSFFEGDLLDIEGNLQHVFSPSANTSVNVTFRERKGNLLFYDTEMTQLDIGGAGNPQGVLYEGVLLPPNIHVRLDPQRPTRGEIILNQLTGQLDSHFDVSTEISFDSGRNWIPSLGSTRMETSVMTETGMHEDFNNPDDFQNDIIFVGSAQPREFGGFFGSGYVSITDALNDQRGAMIVPNLLNGDVLDGGFKLSAAVRLGGGTDQPADGLSFNFVRPDDPLLQDPIGEGYASSPTGEQNLPEEGSTTGLAIGFDEWFSGGEDVIGLSVRIDGELVSQVELPTLNGDFLDVTSLQTGTEHPLDIIQVEEGQLEFAPVEIMLTEDNQLTVNFKGQTLIDQLIDYDRHEASLVIGGRTGGANSHHHIDDLWLEFLGRSEIDEDPCDFNQDGLIDIQDVDSLRDAIQAENNQPEFDITGDGLVNLEDLRLLITGEGKLHTFFGDANLDGEFNSNDLIKIFQGGKYNNNQKANWMEGDWNGDGVFNPSDLIVAFADGGYELGPKWNPDEQIGRIPGVPEPAGLALVICGILGLVRIAGRRR